MHNHGIPQQLEILDDLVKISEELKAPLVAANDSHYVAKADSSAHDALLCVQTNAIMEDENEHKEEDKVEDKEVDKDEDKEKDKAEDKKEEMQSEDKKSV